MNPSNFKFDDAYEAFDRMKASYSSLIDKVMNEPLYAAKIVGGTLGAVIVFLVLIIVVLSIRLRVQVLKKKVDYYPSLRRSR